MENNTSFFMNIFLLHQTPDIAIELPKNGLKLYQPAEIMVSFKSPIWSALTEGNFELRGDGHVQDTTKRIS